jgi:RNA polymerase sigma-70 factor, ECF subfamily
MTRRVTHRARRLTARGLDDTQRGVRRRLPAAVTHGRDSGTSDAGQLPPDPDLVHRLRLGEEAAFVMLLDAWTPGMLRLARTLVATDASAAEVLQDTWLAVIRGINGFQGRSSLRTWAYRILVNTARRRGQQEARAIPWGSLGTGDADWAAVDPARFQDSTEPAPGHWRQFPTPWPSPEDVAISGEIRQVVAAAVTRLPDQQRTVITLRDMEGYNSVQVCQILGISPANQRVLLHRARAAARTALESYFE